MKDLHPTDERFEIVSRLDREAGESQSRKMRIESTYTANLRSSTCNAAGLTSGGRKCDPGGASWLQDL